MLGYAISEGIATLTLNRPEALNALDPETQKELFDAFTSAKLDPEVRVLIVTATGERAFCVGADLKKTMPPKESHAELSYGRHVAPPDWQQAIGMDKPIIAAINGLALGGGLELALACDIRIAAEHANFALPEVKVGSIPGAGGTQRLPRTIGLSDAMLMLFTGAQVSAAEAQRMGIVSRVVPAAELMEKAREIALQIAANAPLSVAAVKRLAYRGLNMTLEAGIEQERMTWGILRDTEDRIEGRVAFREKRKPVYRGR